MVNCTMFPTSMLPGVSVCLRLRCKTHDKRAYCRMCPLISYRSCLRCRPNVLGLCRLRLSERRSYFVLATRVSLTLLCFTASEGILLCYDERACLRALGSFPLFREQVSSPVTMHQKARHCNP